tara:strand:+ start:543 stop:740 length:198 start_codon:yes stop_codon:yes gene_type:complete
MDYRKISKNIEVIKLLKKRKEIEDKIFKLDENALINYELKLLSSPAINESFPNAFEVNKVISKFK